MQAPLGRAVIGGLVMSTFATLLVAPLDLRAGDRQEGGRLAVDLPGRPREHALRPGGLRRRVRTDHDAKSTGNGTADHEGRGVQRSGAATTRTRSTSSGRSSTRPARSATTGTHYTVDDLRVALGFDESGPGHGHRPPTARPPAGDAPERPGIAAASIPDAHGGDRTRSDRHPPEVPMRSPSPHAPARASWRPSPRPGCGHKEESHYESVSKPPDRPGGPARGPERSSGSSASRASSRATSGPRSTRS